jgi:ferredoxin
MKVSIDADRCQGHTLCAMAAPEVFGLRDEDGHAYVLVAEVEGALLAAAQRGASTCPEQAISITEG